LSATAGCAAAGKPVIGWLSDEFGARVTIWLALSFQCVALLTFTVADTFALALVGACLYGLGYSGMSPLRSFAISTTIGNASFASAAGVLRVIEAPLVLTASPIAGFIYDTTGSYRLAFLILAGVMAVACVGPFFIKAGGARARAQHQKT
ncbi:MAG: MFS transporter, partial [Caldilineaceae bacterium]|nr:MFS transporter [Caldilineaceae bacterium]